jgi:hypothetical protein
MTTSFITHYLGLAIGERVHRREGSGPLRMGVFRQLDRLREGIAWSICGRGRDILIQNMGSLLLAIHCWVVE